MITVLDSADQAIEKIIKQLCQDLAHANYGSDEFVHITDAISKLRASLNPTIIQQSE